MNSIDIACGKLSKDQLNQNITIQGYVHAIRNHGTLIFIDVGDKSGWVQTLFHPEINKESYQQAQKLKDHSVVRISGKIQQRQTDLINPKISTGDIELVVDQIEILNLSATWPFGLNDQDINEETRLRYRYLDLRRNVMQENLRQRHRILHAIRNFLNQNEFIEIETPILNKSTPEGARDFLIPSRLNPGEFYALPQSPQIFKQIIVGSWFEKYYQIARCFRDEDMRADRQLEFTQLDLEIAFAKKQDVINLIENLFCYMLKECYQMDLKTPFPIYTYDEAIHHFGTDSPDIRFDLLIHDLSTAVKSTQFQIFKKVIDNDGIVLGINVSKGTEKLSNKDINALVTKMIELGANGLAWAKVGASTLTGNIANRLEPQVQKNIIQQLKANQGDLLLFVADKNAPSTYQKLGQLRLILGRQLNLIDKKTTAFAWVINFPLFEYNHEEHRFDSVHHPFTRPMDSSLNCLDNNPEKAKSEAYDLVLNGVEVGGGSLRIHEQQLQKKIFELLNLSVDEIEQRFGFFLESLHFGQPPHGGIALGIDRIVMLLQNETTIRNVIAFPKTQKGICSMSQAPTTVSLNQLDELFIQTKTTKEKK